MDIISYESPVTVKNETTLPATLTITEATIFSTTDQRYLKKSQLTVMNSVTLGGVASATFYYYLSPNGTDWFPISLYNTTSGEMTQRNVLVDSGSYVIGGVSSFSDNVPLGACYAFKITAKSASGTPVYTTSVISRDN